MASSRFIALAPRGPHVLYADDDELLRQVAGALLRGIGGRVSVAADADELRAVLARAREEGHAVELVFLDVRFGDASGLDVCRELRAAGVDIPIVAVSGDLDALAETDYSEAGFDATVEKPIAKEELVACASRLLGTRHTP